MTDPKRSGDATRRDFLKTAAAGAAALSAVPMAHAAGKDTIRVGLVGCGGRGRGAVENIIEAGEGSIRITAIGDVFKDAAEGARDGFKSKFGDAIDIGDRVFHDFDNYKKVIESDVDLVILATPPGFRPDHIEYAVKAGKHIFAEKPVAVDGPGIRRVLAAYEEAKSKNLGILTGTQRRHSADYLEAMKQIHEGAIGEIVSGRVYWNQGLLWHRGTQPNWTEMEYQLRNWYYYTWLCGDHIVEQHVHNLDVANWGLKAHPVKASGMGGRQVRTEPKWGHIFDHFAIEYTYPNGAVVHSYCRQTEGCESNVSETLVGTKGTFTSHGGLKITGENKWRKRGPRERDAYVQEHIDLLASIREGKPLNELKQVAESTLTAIMGRMAAYTGKAVEWEEALNSQQVLMPKELAWGPLATPPVAVPGQTPLV